MVPFMRPIVDGGFVPDSCRGNDERAIEKRIEMLKKEPQHLEVFVSKVMDEYVEHFWRREKWLAHPVEYEDVAEKQSTRSQQLILGEAQHGTPTGVTKQFMKREAYMNVNDPRIISTVCPPDKLSFSAYAYTVAAQQKTHKWYAFGKTPREVAVRVAHVCSNAQVVAQTDCSRMDGNYDERANELHRRLFAYGFRREYHVNLFALMSRMVNIRGVTMYGVKCTTGQAELSGKPTTAVDNTNLNAFQTYLGYRMTPNPVTGTYYNPKEAWCKLGIYGGDDGLSADYDGPTMIRAARRMGQVLTLEGLKRGESGVTFLARRYGPDVWFGDNTSTCDLPRQLAKFHLTTALPSTVTRERKLCEKAFAFFLTDKHTPVIGAFVQRVAVLFPVIFPDYQNLLKIWGVEMDENVQYPNEYADWMEDSARQTLPTFDRQKFADWLSGTTEQTIFEIVQCCDAVTPIAKDAGVVVEGDVVLPLAKKEVPKREVLSTKSLKPEKIVLIVPKVSGQNAKSSKPDTPRKMTRPRKPKSARTSRQQLGHKNAP